MRRLLILAVALLLALPALNVAAQEDRAPLPVALGDLELLPIHEIEWAILLDEHRDVVTRLMFLGERVGKVWGHLQARENKQDAGSRKLLSEIGRIEETIRPQLVRLLELVQPFGVDDEVLRVLDDTPQGALRVERQAMRVVLRVPDLTARQRRLLAPLVRATEGALLTLEGLKGREGIDSVVIDVEKTALQKRFWRIADSTLDRDQRVALRRRLPKDMAKYVDLFAVLYTLPELTSSQGSRLKALLVELEQAAAPDTALAARTKDERVKREAESRNVALMVRAWREGRSILTPDQLAELAAVPPLLSVQERPGDLEVWLKAFDLDGAQQKKLQALFVRYGPVKGRMLQGLARAAVVAEGFGPDAPQQEMAETMRAQAYAEALVAARRAAHEIVLDVLTDEQLLGWVLGGDRRAAE